MASDRSLSPADAEPSDPVRLESWKAIATYLGRGVTTVQRWEREEGLPVRRHAHAARGSVFAFRSEVDAWRRSRELPRADVAAEPERGVETPDAPLAEPVRAPRAWRSRSAVAWMAGLVVIVGAALLTVAGGRSGGSEAATVPHVVAGGEGLERQPALSPDGRRIVFSRRIGGGALLFVKPAAGGVAQPLRLDEAAAPTRFDAYPRWSPDGRTIAFLREILAAVWQVRVVSADGGTSRPLLRIHTAAVSWMPDAATIVVLDRHAQGQPYAAFLVSVATGTRLRQLTFPPEGTFGDWQCAVSPDGRELAVVRYRTQYQGDLWVVDVASGAERRVTSGLRGIDGVDWSPDGRRLVVSAAGAEGASLWQVSSRPAAGELPLRLLGTDGGRTPTVSRRGGATVATLAFARAPVTYSLWRWDPGRIDARRLTRTLAGDEQPAISPDGRHLAFVSLRAGAPELWVAPIDGGEPRRLTFRREPVATPRWSHDSRRLVFTSWTGDNADIYSVLADGSASPWRLTFEPTDEGNPSWALDDRHVYFRSDRGGLQRIWRAPGDGGPAVPVTQGEGSQAIESADGAALYFVRNRNVPGLWRTTPGGGPETLLVPNVWEGYWDVTHTGIVIFERPRRAMTDPLAVRLYEPGSNTVDEVGALPIASHTVRLGVSASADARTLVWGTVEPQRSELMIASRWPPPDRMAQGAAASSPGR